MKLKVKLVRDFYSMQSLLVCWGKCLMLLIHSWPIYGAWQVAGVKEGPGG